MKKIICLALLLGSARSFADNGGDKDWPNHGNDLANTRFQDVDQINRSNVGDLRVAWWRLLLA